MAVLTNDQIIEIRERYRLGEKQTSLAKEYCVTQGTISRIVSGARWGHLEGKIEMGADERSQRYRGINRGPRKKPTVTRSKEDIKEIRKLSEAGMSDTLIGQKFNMDRAYVYQIRKRLIWKNVD